MIYQTISWRLSTSFYRSLVEKKNTFFVPYTWKVHIYIYILLLYMAGIDSLSFSAPLFSPSLQAVNPYKGTSAGPVNHAEVLEMNKSSQDKDSTYLLSACCIRCEMESGESLPKKANAEKWEMNLVWECSYVHRLQIPTRAHCSCLGQSYSLCLCPSACFSISPFFCLSL